jgi:GTP-binding protein YchF
MNLSLGIVGLPNVGKSTLFNALTKQNVLAANYPFATIDPNQGIVIVFDERLNSIADTEKPEKVVPAVVEFVDIAGIVKGAADGQGLGNKFLANIREVSAIVQVVRAFKNDNITHVENSIDPVRDIELINTELILKDIESLFSKLRTFRGAVKNNPKLKSQMDFLEGLYNHLEEGKVARDYVNSTDEETKKVRKELFLLTDKPVIYLVNSTESEFEKDKATVEAIVGKDKTIIPMDVKIEAELAQLDDEEKLEFMKELGMEKSGLQILTQEAYRTLGLISFFTSGPMESRAWTIKLGETAPEAAAAIHTDISDNFIAADIVNWKDFIENGGWVKAKEKGKVRLEGKNYVMQDGDVVLFKHNG